MCSKHPDYRVMRTPRSGCIECWAMYKEKHPDRYRQQLVKLAEQAEEDNV